VSSHLRELAERVRGRVLLDEPLAPYTTYRIGGPAAALVLPESVDDVLGTLMFAAESGTRWLALGLGSNVLIADHGFDGIVIRLGKGLDRVDAGVEGDDTRWSVGAGLPTPRLARRTAKAGLGGVHRLIGVPGSVGGGVFMNAGAHGQDYSQVVRRVTAADGSGTIHQMPATEVPWRYRSSGLGERIVLETVVELAPTDPKQLAREIRQYSRWRKAGTPFNEPCCGSVFRNPAGRVPHPLSPSPEAGEGGPHPLSPSPEAGEGGPHPLSPSPEAGEGGRGVAEGTGAVGGRQRTAGQLIDAVGLKGYRVGGAQVSRKHANYVVNVGGATARDVLAVIEHVRERVRAEFDVELELEVRVID
jgi:UDP-N-acetylmuramate dehydrogenase